MRRGSVVALSLAVVAATSGAAHAVGDVTDVVAAVSLPGVVTITGAGLSTAQGALNGAGSATIGGSTGDIPGATLQVTDATGGVLGWDVTATYADLAGADLTAVADLTPDGTDSAVNIGASGIAVTTSTNDAQKTANNTLGVAEAGIAFKAATVLAVDGVPTPVKVATVDADGRGVTAFNTSYNLTLPTKGVLAGTIYTGSVVYTVAPQAE